MWSARWERTILFFFCLHVLAVAMDAIPGGSPFSAPLRTMWAPLTRPYVALTAQWQRWNLFAPAPLREVVTVSIDVREREEWKELWAMAPGKLPWWRETALLKVARAFAQEDRRYVGAREDALKRACALYRLSPRAQVRLRVRSRDLFDAAEERESVRAELFCS